jgi:sulfur carrier protein
MAFCVPGLGVLGVEAVRDAAMQVRINGKPRDVREGLSISALLEDLGIQTRYAAVALNGEVVRRADHAAVIVKEGDRIEIVHAVSGGR